jgi:hypothetical protein
MSFSQVQRVFIVENYLEFRSYLTCQNEFRDTFPDSPLPNKSTISRLVNRYRDTGTLHQVTLNIRKRVNAYITESSARNAFGYKIFSTSSILLCSNVQE